MWAEKVNAQNRSILRRYVDEFEARKTTLKALCKKTTLPGDNNLKRYNEYRYCTSLRRINAVEDECYAATMYLFWKKSA